VDPKKHEYMHNKVKMETSVEELCLGYPKQFAEFLHHGRGLGFYEQPDYSYLRSLFRDLFIQRKFQLDHVYDWTVSRSPSSQQQEQQANVSYCPPVTAYRRKEVVAN